MKKVALLIFALLITLSSTSCGLGYRYSLDEALHDQIEVVWEEDDSSYAIYHGKKYVYQREGPFFSIDTRTEDVLLSWNGPRYFGYAPEFRSYTSDSPLFFYTYYGIYVHEGYDFSKDTFLVGDTDLEIAWEDALDQQQPDFVFRDPCTFYLYSKQCDRIKIRLDIVRDGDRYYLSLPRSEGIWTPSDEFAELLAQAGITEP